MLTERLPAPTVQRSETSAHPRSTGEQWPISAKVICGLLLPVDIAVIAVTATAAYQIRFFDTPTGMALEYALLVAFGVLLAVNVFKLGGMYDRDILRKPVATLRRLAVSWLAVAATLMALGFLTKTSEDYSRLWSVMWLGSCLAALVAVRLVLFSRAARWNSCGRLKNKIAIVGNGSFAQRAAVHFASNPDKDVHFVGIFTDEMDRDGVRSRYDDCDGNLDRLVSRIRDEQVDTVVVALPHVGQDRLNRVFEVLSEVPVDVRICPGPEAFRLLDHGVSYYAGLPTIDVMDRPLADWRQIAKDVEDRVLGAAILILITPVMALIAIAIKLDSPGPVLFRQKRFGFNNEVIEVFKFRTMYVECTDKMGNQLTERNDPRVTRLGRILRTTSLDELPQFLNVLRGEMSIVGPRPHAIASKAGGYLYRDAVTHYDARHRVKPGITGWAQINGWRGPTETVRQIRKRVEHDLYYIENWSLWFDLKIIAFTIVKGFHSKYAF